MHERGVSYAVRAVLRAHYERVRDASVSSRRDARVH